MLKLLSSILFIFPVLAFAGSITESGIVGDWEHLGGAWEKTKDFTKLVGPGPNIKRFHSDGKYEYISIIDGKQGNPVVGEWVYKDGVLSITRPDNGTINNKVSSYTNGVLEMFEDFCECYQYMKKK